MESKNEAHIMLVPFPAQGHMSPMMQFSKRLASKGVRVTFVAPADLQKSMKNSSESCSNKRLYVEYMSYDFDRNDMTSGTMECYMSLVKLKVKNNLTMLIEEQKTSGHPVTFLVFDSLYPSGVDIGHELGLKAASFFTQSCAVAAIYYNVHQGKLNIPLDNNLSTVSLPSMPLLESNDLPIIDIGTMPDFLSHFSNQFSDIHKADFVFFNTFDKLENEVMKWLYSQFRFLTIGPTIPSMYLDKQLADDKDYSINIFKPDPESCIKWLDARESGSVVYVSFGSVSFTDQKVMDEVALGLLRSNCYFLFVIRDFEQSKLPSNFLTQSTEKGLVVSWCSQLQVLAHKAVGCFMTHCGWNSTLEALSLGVPMIVLPRWFDQTCNAKYIVDVWRAGIRIKVDEKGNVGSEEIATSINTLMNEEVGDELRRNVISWKELAIEAMAEGGSSHNNIDEFIATLVSV